MKLQLARVPRKPNWPMWAAAVFLGWAALVGTATFLANLVGHNLSLCVFKRLTGIPCLTCGSTRGAISFARGDLVGAWWCNPLVFSVAVVFFTALLVRVMLGRAIVVDLSRRQRTAAWVLAGAAVLLNWTHVIFNVG